MPTILLIDDEPAIQHAFRKAFHPPEYDTTTVPTAAEGLQRLSTKRRTWSFSMSTCPMRMACKRSIA